MEYPKVSIIIPTYKRPDRVSRAINSALAQQYPKFEVIVVDDNDPQTEERQKTEKIISRYSDERLIYLKHEKNKNGSAARNTGMKYSSGEYITFLDDDDEYYPNKIKEQVGVLSNLNNSYGACYSSYEKIDQYGNKQISAETAEGDVKVQVLSKNLFVGSGSNFMFRSSIVNDIGYFDVSFDRNQDLEYLARISLKYKIKYVDKIHFLIHNEIREKKYSYSELVSIHDNYRKKFANYIRKLEYKEQQTVNKVLALMDFRIALFSGKIIEAIKIVKNSELSVKDIIKFMTYLLDRVRTKRSYGFTLEKTV